ncbi:phage portal protein [Candidatus Pacearchaeota archaeon]|nr:phage portal protein [Candidatus Pacearchaeota archaeon]
MALLQPLVEIRSSTIGLNAGDPELSNYFGSSSNSHSSQTVNENTSLTVSTVFACVNRKAKTLAMLPLNVMRKLPDGGKEVAVNHRLYKELHDRPNRWQTSYDWRVMMHGHLMLRGNAYSQIVYHPGRRINELVPMSPDRVWPFVIKENGTILYLNPNSPAPDYGDKLFYQYFSSGGETIILRAEEVLHIRGFSTNGIVGKNVVQLMREAVGIAMATEEQGARLFSNGAQIGKVFTHPSKLGDATYLRLKSELDKNTVGVENAHRTLILEDGMKIEQTTLTMEDAQFLETRKFQVEDIASFLDVPLILINRSGDKNQTFASAEQIISIFVTHMMGPDFINWEQSLNKDLLYASEKSEYYFDFDFGALMRGDTKARGKYLSERFAMGSLSPDEIKIYEGESPTGTPEGKKYYIGSGILPIENAGQKIETSSKQPDEGDEGDE